MAGSAVEARHRAPKFPARAAGPQQQADGDADGGADGDVLDPDQANLPAGGRDEIEDDDQVDGERRLAGDEADGGGSIGGEEDGEGERHPHDGRVIPGQHGEDAADHDPDDVPGQRLERGAAGAERGRPQDLECPEHDPEGV